MEQHIIVVIGSVTARQYEPLRLDVIRAGFKPKIVRFEPEQVSAIEFEICCEVDHGVSVATATLREGHDLVLKAKHGFSFDDVVGVIMDEKTHLCNFDHVGTVFTSANLDDCPRLVAKYVFRPNGVPEYI